ncbi:MAG: nitrite reductase (NAD(P)H) small subunit, partial [Mesorhizobium sp.]
FAIEDHCPHKGGPLSQGIVHGAAVTCPLHNWVISLETGKALGADEGSVRTIPVRIEGERLFIALEALASKAA